MWLLWQIFTLLPAACVCYFVVVAHWNCATLNENTQTNSLLKPTFSDRQALISMCGGPDVVCAIFPSLFFGRLPMRDDSTAPIFKNVNKHIVYILSICRICSVVIRTRLLLLWHSLTNSFLLSWIETM